MKTIGHDAKPAANRKHWQWLFPASVIVVYVSIYFVAPDRTINALMASGNVLKQMALPLLLAFVMMVVLNLFITPAHVSRFLGSRAGIKGVLLSSVAGILSMGPVYAWLPFLAAIREKGASDFHLANFLASRAVKPVLLPLMIGYFGWRFSLIFTVLNMVGALLVASAVIYVCDGQRKSS
ncbi:MAG: permease [Desulfosarcina sp.]|nr:permease [Desulfosarcina sp.]MBC2743115.1 permease [Desulfosarcina sp.]MBC2766025.1 permease [Desulfosarcina sp.]